MEVGCKSIKQQKQRSRMLSALMEVCNGAVERMQQDEHNHNNDAPDDSLSNETVAVKMQPDQDTAAVKEATGSTRCRSLLCDANGTFVAELVYRCLMCNALHEQASDAQSHYLNRHTCTSNSIALLQRPANEEEEDEDEKRSDAMSSDADLEEDIDFHIKRRKAQHTDNRSFGRTLPVSDNHRVPDPTTLTNRRTMNAMDSRLSSDSGTYSGSQMLMADESFDDARSSPTSSEAATPLDDRQDMKPQLSCTRSGYITCPVCNSTRYYTTLQRRYGQFTCVACYRFFKEFFLHPKRFECATLTKCPLNVKNKCRACWIAACSRVYSVDPKRDAVLSANFPYQNETNQLHHGDDDDETKQEDAKSSDSDVVTETTTITTVTNSNEESVTRSASPLSLESQNDLMSSAIILQQFLEQSNRLKHCLQTSSGTADRHSVIGQTNSSPEIYTSSEMIDSSHCDVGDANQKPSNETGNCDSIMNSDQDPANMLYSPSSRLSGVSAVAAAAVAVEKATIRQQEQQHQQRLNEALCAEMLMKLESVAAQQQQSSVGSGDIEPGLRNAGDYADSRPESECENHSALSMMDTYNGNVGNLTEHHSRHPHHHQINANDQIETLENSMFVNLLPDLEGIGIGSNGPQCKTDACCTSELLNDAKSLKSLIKRRRKSKSAVSSPTVESDFVSGIKKSKARVKNWCCLKCSNCLADDCGKCINCLDRPKFGGPFIRKQRCINKRCLMKGSKLERNNIVSNGSNTIIISNGAIASCETSSLNQPLFDRSMNSVPTIDD